MDVEPAPETAEDEPKRRSLDRTIERSEEGLKMVMEISLEGVEVTFGGIAPVCLSLPKLLTILAS